MEIDCLDVVIVGGGIAGSALGIILSRSDVSFGLFEKDSSFGSRKQGYGLTIQHHDALSVLGLDEIVRSEDTVNDAHFIFSPKGELCSVFGRFLDDDAKQQPQTSKTAQKKRYNVHLPRQRLRELLLEKLEEKSEISWGWKLESYEHKDDDGIYVTMVNEEKKKRTIKTKLLVGADGIYSVVRKLRMESLGYEDPLRYLGMLVVLGMTPSSHELCLKTTFQTLDGTTRLFTMPFTVRRDGKGEDVTFWQLSFPCEEAEALRLKSNIPELKKEIEKRCSTWHAPVPALLMNGPAENITATPVYDRGEAYPFLKNFPNVIGSDCVTLIGDAAHPMSPFKGQGANQALLDGVLLGQCICKCFDKTGGKLDKAEIMDMLKLAEQKMYERAEKKVEDSRKVAIRLHTSKDAAHDPATRGISEDMLKMFRELNVTADLAEEGGQKLREAVRKCVEKNQRSGN